MKKLISRYFKFMISIFLICAMIMPSYATIAASDGSSFVTKAEFDSALADFNTRLTTFEAGINSKIDSQVTSYLDRNGIWSGKDQTIANLGLPNNVWAVDMWHEMDRCTLEDLTVEVAVLTGLGSSSDWPSYTTRTYTLKGIKLNNAPRVANKVIVNELNKSGLCLVTSCFSYLVYNSSSSGSISDSFWTSSSNRGSSYFGFHKGFTYVSEGVLNNVKYIDPSANKFVSMADITALLPDGDNSSGFNFAHVSTLSGANYSTNLRIEDILEFIVTDKTGKERNAGAINTFSWSTPESGRVNYYYGTTSYTNSSYVGMNGGLPVSHTKQPVLNNSYFFVSKGEKLTAKLSEWSFGRDVAHWVWIYSYSTTSSLGRLIFFLNVPRIVVY